MPKTPRYLELAGELRRAIASGKLKVGAQLPTEFELCATHSVSRHTARAALKVLEDARLIDRRPGLGTRVIAREDSRAFTQPLGGLAELLQYAREARLITTSTGRVRLADRDALRLGAPSGSTWLRFEGVRAIDGERIAATAIYILSAIGARAEDFRGTKRAFTEEVEKRYGVGVAAITQTIRAELLTGNDAAALKAPAGSPILRTVRRYYDAAGRLFVLSDTRHPAERFSYEMSFRRQSSPDTQMTPLSRSRRRSAAE